MSIKAKKAIIIAINILLAFIFVVIQYTPVISLKIANAVPMLPLALVISVSMFCSELTSSITGMFIGIFTDTSSATSFGFNSVIFFVIGFLTSFLIHYLFNNNFRTAIFLGITLSCMYFLLKWSFFYIADHSMSDSFIYLFQHALPSVIYTAVFTLLIYLFEGFIFKKIIKI